MVREFISQLPPDKLVPFEKHPLSGAGGRHTVAVTGTPHEAVLPRGKVDARGVVRHSYRGKAQSERVDSHQNRVAAEVFPAQLLCAADGAGDHEAAGGPLPREGQGSAMIFAYWRYTDFSRTMLAERGELYMEQNLPPLPPVIFENGLYYELRGEQYYPCLLPPEPDTTEDKLLETIIRQMAEAQGIEKDLKARDQMAWVGAMNNIKSAALEILRESK